jgi:hypothetical protein
MRAISNEPYEYHKRAWQVCERMAHESGIVWYAPLGRPHGSYESALATISGLIKNYKINKSDLIVMEQRSYILPCEP